jgi:branched-chain amino acid aminotransferase
MAIYIINNTIVDENAPFFSPKSRSYRYGDGFFESCKLSNGRILQLPLHGDRIRKSALLLKLNLPTWWDEISWETTVLKACKEANIASARIRLTIFRDADGLYTPNDSSVCLVTEINEAAGIGPYQWNEEGLNIGTYKELAKNSN